MSFTKKFLTDLGVEDEKAEQIFEIYKEEINALKSDSKKLAEVQKQLDEANKKLTESEDFKSQLEKLKSEISAKEITERKSGALRKILKEKGYSDRGIEKISKYGGYIDGIELDENGGIKNSDKLVTEIENEWSEYKPSETTDYTEPSTPPKNNNTNGTESEASKYAEAYYKRVYGEKKEA